MDKRTQESGRHQQEADKRKRPDRINFSGIRERGENE
jgi:hypothetical protein